MRKTPIEEVAAVFMGSAKSGDNGDVVQRCAADILTGPSKALNLIRQLFLCRSSTFEQHYSHYKSLRAFKIEDFSC